MANLAIIPARGGSKRIPRKNIKDFLGKPIIAYSIETALKSGLFDEVMVSTDDKEIAEIAIQFGAKVPFFRSDKMSDDYATTIDVIHEVINEYQSLGKIFTNVCCIYPTAPLIKIKRLQDGLSQLVNDNFSSVFPVVKFSYPIWRSLAFNGENKINMIWPQYLNSRSQDLSPAYHDAGQWYWFKPDDANKSLLTDNSGAMILDETEVQDIDDLTDWKLAELKFKLLHDN